MKNKKIMVLGIIVLCVICMLLIGFFVLKEHQKVSNIETQQEENSITENEIATSEKSNTLEENIEVATDENLVSDTESTDTINQTAIKATKTTQEKKAQETSPATTQKQAQASSTQPSTATVQTTQTQVPSQTTTPATTQTPTSNQNVESFKVNNSIINQMKNIINSNPSSYMKQFGYNIVVDSSIVNQTTGFTYTETRVKNAIANSFGTIRIYARDYYVGNELRWTEGFIL